VRGAFGPSLDLASPTLLPPPGYDSPVVDSHLSISGHPVSPLQVTTQDRSRLWATFYPVVALPGAIGEGDWIEVAFWILGFFGLLAIHRFGQPVQSRTLSQKTFLLALTAVGAVLVVVPITSSSTWRIVGVAISPLPFLIDIALARRPVEKDGVDRSRRETL
jgi:hypothetical protein